MSVFFYLGCYPISLIFRSRSSRENYSEALVTDNPYLYSAMHKRILRSFPLQQTRILLLELQSIIGSSREITELRALIKIVGPSDATVMIMGDSGTGKELVAKALHGCSDRAQGPFIPINCGAIPKDL